VVGWHRNRDLVITELKRELAAAQELFVLPTGVIGVRTHAREPLRHAVDPVAIRQVFSARAAARHACIVDRVGPVQLECHTRARLQSCWQLDAHHGVDRMGLEREAADQLYILDRAGPIKARCIELTSKRAERSGIEIRSQTGQHRMTHRRTLIRLNLHP